AAGPILDRIAARYAGVTETLLEIPRTIIHGDFYASNILVYKQETETRVCPVDWEMAGIGARLLDVAALASGNWSHDQRMRILESYESSLPERLPFQDVVRAFDCCQLQIAIQWLGWSQTWSPPQTHAHNWLTEALRISTESSLAPLFG